MRDAAEAWLKLALTPGLPPLAAARAVAAAGGDPGVAARWPVERLAHFGSGRADARVLRRPVDVDVEPVRRRCAALGVRILTPDAPDWPGARLAGLADPPAALFLAGRLPDAPQRTAGIVGTRRASPYGLRVARDFGESLARLGVCVVSGLALGVDAAAHAGALAAPAREAYVPTLAVLGHGHACVYPPENALLKDEIAAAGGVLSEYPPDTPPERWHFPRRNRLVAALVGVLVVVEAPERSGALLTAALAVEAGRHVLAVPGAIDRLVNEGSHRLLKEGTAELCRGVQDVLVALGLSAEGAEAAHSVPASLPPPPGPQLALWALLDGDEALDADALCLRSGLPADEVLGALAELELDGRVVRLPGVGFLRR